MGRHQLGLLVVVGVGVGAMRVNPQGEARGETILYVDANASGPTHNGASWCNAYLELQPALSVAAAGTTIRVADGVYRPDPSGLPNPRQATFPLKNGVVLEGGYAGCGAPDPNARNTNPSATILSGDALGNDPTGNEFRDCCNASYLPGCPDAACAAAVCAQYSFCCEFQWEEICAQTAQSACGTLCDSKDDNSYHVVTGSGTDTTAVLDGVTITLGQADELTAPWEDAKGAGMYVQGGGPTIRNCLFRRNDAYILGGGLYVHTGSPQVIGCTFDDNRARNYFDAGNGTGGGAYVEAGNPLFSGCMFTANAVDLTGAGIQLEQAGGTIEDCRFAGNSGPAIDCFGSSPLIERCTILGNGGGIFFDGGTPTIRNCSILGNFGPGIYFYGSTGEVINSLIVGNFSGGSGGGVSCERCDATVQDCTIVGNTAYNWGGGIYVYATGDATVVNSVLWGNSARLEGQQLHLRTLAPDVPRLTVSYSDVQGGQSAVGGSGTLVWGPANIDQDPSFVDLDGADGTIGNEDDNLRLLPGSPCVDAGDNSAVPPTVLVDLDGRPRIVDGTADGAVVVDMGAYEGPEPIPALTEWGVAIMTLLVLIVGTLLIRFRGNDSCFR
jgi:hypothetical protein